MKARSSLPGYTTRDVARLLGLSEGQVRSYVRAGFLEPRRGSRGRYLFGFQDLVVLRAAGALVAARIPAARVRRSLARLREELPRGRSLAALRLTAEGGHIVVRDGGEAWEPESGQRLLDFDVAELAELAGPLTHRRMESARDRAAELDAEDWFEMGLELEASRASESEARDAYRRALALDEGHGDAHLNLGRLLHEAGEVVAAERHYRRALAAGGATAAFNLGVALQDQGRCREAVEAYRASLAADPFYADAYYNLSGLHEQMGRPAEALRSLKAYKELTGR